METIAVYLGSYIGAFIISQRASIRLKSFLRKHSSITDEQVLKEFQSVVRREMYENLFLLVLLGIGFGTGLALASVVPQHYAIWRLAIIYTPVAFFALHSVMHKKLEKQVRSIPAANEELAQIYRQVCKAWREKFLPNF